MEPISGKPSTTFPTKEVLGKADLHIHSTYSRDGLSSIKGILEMADRNNLDLIAITDHDTIKGAEEAQKLASDFKVKVIKGEEIGTKEGHLIALFIEEFIHPKKPILDTIREIHRQRGLAIVSHSLNPLARGVSSNILFQIFPELDGIELFNAAWCGWANQKKLKRLNSEIFNLAAIGGSDAHILRQVGKGYTIFEGKDPTDLYFSIKHGLTLAEGIFTPLDYFEWAIKLPGRILMDTYHSFKNKKIFHWPC